VVRGGARGCGVVVVAEGVFIVGAEIVGGEVVGGKVEEVVEGAGGRFGLAIEEVLREEGGAEGVGGEEGILVRENFQAAQRGERGDYEELRARDGCAFNGAWSEVVLITAKRSS
jgi:hypothetical protein